LHGDILLKFLITGGAGRLSKALIQILTSSGFNAIAFDLPYVNWDEFEAFTNVEIYKGDVTDPVSILKSCKSVDAIIHLAAILPMKSEVDKDLTFKVNVDGTRNIVNALKTKKDVPIVLASSISTYGITVEKAALIKEIDPQEEHNIYSASKIMAEHLIRESGIPSVILRIAPIAVADLVELPDIIPYRADQRVEFIDVEDAAIALFESVKNPKALGKTLNIAGGASWQLTGSEYISKFYEALGVDIDPTFSEKYTAIDWYDTSKSRFLGYQRTNFNDFLKKLRVLGEELGLR
jgi:nucleoside-diphosphate-sugar epimerase